MANGFGSFYIGTSGLQSAQNALNTTANNLANVDTKGYVREQVRFTDKNYIMNVQPTVYTNMQQSGLGVSIGDVMHARDIFLDKAYRQESGREAFYSACYDSATYVEDLFQELAGQEFKYSISDFWQAFQELAKDPANSTNQNLVFQKAELLLSRTTNLYKDLQSYQSNINEQIKEEVNRVNELGNRIYELNLQIQKVESNGLETAMTLRDERDLLLDELSSYAKIATKEDVTGFVFVDLEDAPFIDEARCYEIGLWENKGTGFVTPYWKHMTNSESDEYVEVFRIDTELSTEANTDIGSIKAKLKMRGKDYGRYDDMEAGKYDMIEDCVVMETQAEIDALIHKMVNAINDLFCPNDTAATVGVPAGSYFDENGNGVTVSADTLVLDTNHCAYGADHAMPEELFVRVGCSRYTAVYDSTDPDTRKVVGYVFNEEDPDNTDRQYAIGSVSVNKALQKQITLMPAYTDNGAVDYSMGERLTDAWDEQIMGIGPNDTVLCTFAEYYDKVISRLGTTGSVYRSAADTLSNATYSIDTMRQQLSGVSSDEELSNMVKYQSAYNAASRYITVISQMTELIVGLI